MKVKFLSQERTGFACIEYDVIVTKNDIVCNVVIDNVLCCIKY